MSWRCNEDKMELAIAGIEDAINIYRKSACPVRARRLCGAVRDALRGMVEVREREGGPKVSPYVNLDNPMWHPFGVLREVERRWIESTKDEERCDRLGGE